MKELEYAETATKLRLMRKTKGTYIAVSASFSGRGGSRIRTGDPMLAKHVLYQLSYTPMLLVGPGRVELPTSTLSV